MLKRSLFIGVLCLCLIALVGTDASARCRVIGGVLKCGSLCAGQFMKAVKPDTTAACISLKVEDADVYCANPAGQCAEPPEGTAVPFKPDILLSFSGVVTSAYITGQGQAEFTQEGEDCWDLLEDLGAALDNVCKDQWAPCAVVATKVLGYFSGWNWNKNLGVDGEWEFASDQCIRFIAEPNSGETCGYEYVPITDPNDEDFAEITECEDAGLSTLCANDILYLPYPPSE